MALDNKIDHLAETLAYDKTSEKVHERLTAHNKTLKKHVYQTKDKFYTAVGYAGDAPVMVEGEDGLIIIDPCETTQSMEVIMKEFRKISDKPVKCLVYTHYHPDHWGGAAACVTREQYDAGEVTIIAHELFMSYVSQINGELIENRFIRGMFMFGQLLDCSEEGRTSVGNGAQLTSGTWELFKPTITFKETYEIEVCGIKMKLFHAPSEAEDEIAVYFPEEKILHTAEILQGECFPNIYTIRGTNRSATEWIEAVDKLRACEAEALIGAHIRPLEGKAEVAKLLLDYRDSIQYVRDQTIRLLNAGHTPEAIVDMISLPEHLYQRERMGEFYGTIKQAIRRVYDEFVGWWNGEPSKLDPLPIKERAALYVEAFGGRDKVIEMAQKAIADKNYKWAMEILSYPICLNKEDKEARHLKATAVRSQGYLTENPTWRNWYMTAANHLDGLYDQMRPTQYGQYLEKPVYVQGLKTVLTERLFEIYVAKIN